MCEVSLVAINAVTNDRIEGASVSIGYITGTTDANGETPSAMVDCNLDMYGDVSKAGFQTVTRVSRRSQIVCMRPCLKSSRQNSTKFSLSFII